MDSKHFDILVIGGGHAGVEAVYIASQFKNLSIGLVTMPGVGIASAPCNPSIGGVGKGQVVRELDALGALTGILADKSGIQFRTLNESKGYAVQSTRVQIDKDLYSKNATEELLKIDNLEIIFEKVSDINKGSFYNVITDNAVYTSSKLIITVGTFLNGKLHTGEKQVEGGRVDAESSSSISRFFNEIKTISAKFKTGTPARIYADTVDYSLLEEQPSDDLVPTFHFRHEENQRFLPQKSCYLTRTNEKTLEIIRENKERSPMFNGQIKGVGARYCPSIEDKAYRYPDKNIHHVFVEPEGLDVPTVYPSGVSSSLPEEVQDAFLRTIDGLKDIKVQQYGYAVEYDVIDTTHLNYALEHQEHVGLYFAGQVNGTSGYEEAAAQGYIAGVNAALVLTKQEPLVLSRKDSYIGVMIEDLISNTRDEPYRLFTARSENRLFIREDNSVLRMHKYRKSLGLNSLTDQYNDRYLSYFQLIFNKLDTVFLGPEDGFFKKYDINVPRRTNISELLRMSQLDPIETLKKYLDYIGIDLPSSLIRTIAISTKYAGYIQRADQSYNKVSKLDDQKINYEKLLDSANISFECKQRIEKIKPQTFGQLKIIEGIRPATLAFVASNSL
jgi:tRNA uridine 5-carboxymethylaminomethyl modification enzyme